MKKQNNEYPKKKEKKTKSKHINSNKTTTYRTSTQKRAVEQLLKLARRRTVFHSIHMESFNYSLWKQSYVVDDSQNPIQKWISFNFRVREIKK